MKQARLRHRRLWTNSALLAGAFASAGLCGRSLPAAEVSPKVELRCTIENSPTDSGLTQWNVEVQGKSGEIVRSVVGFGGETLHFKALDPGNYMVCILGRRLRRRCESFDLNIPKSSRSYQFSKLLKVPSAAPIQPGQRVVSVARLSVPAEARQEMLRADEARLRGDVQASMRHLEQALAIDPDYVEALNNLGNYYYRIGNYQRSIELFTRMTTIDPKFYPGWVNLAGSLMASSDLQGAAEANEQAYKLQPNDATVMSQLALNRYYMRDYATAEAFFKKVMELDPAFANSPQLFLAQIALSEQRADEAKGYMEDFLRIHPYSPDAPRIRESLKIIEATAFDQGSEVANARPTENLP